MMHLIKNEITVVLDEPEDSCSTTIDLGLVETVEDIVKKIKLDIDDIYTDAYGEYLQTDSDEELAEQADKEIQALHNFVDEDIDSKYINSLTFNNYKLNKILDIDIVNNEYIIDNCKYFVEVVK